jgi:hypothetical protein
MTEETDGVPSIAAEMSDETASEPSAELAAILKPLRLLTGESEEAYAHLEAKIRAAVAPTTFIEDLLARDIAHFTWEIWRLRRLSAELLAARRSRGIRNLAEEQLGYTKAAKLERARTSDRRDEKLKAALSSQSGINDNGITAELLARNIDDVAEYDRLIASAEARRNAVFREIDRHRDAVVMRRLRENVERIEEAEFEEISPPKAAAIE